MAAWELWPGIDGDKEGSQTPREPYPNSPVQLWSKVSSIFSAGGQSLAFLLAVLTSLEEPRPRPTLKPSQSSVLVNTHVSGSTQSALEATEHQPKGEVNWLLGAVISRQPRVHTDSLQGQS